MSRPSPDVETVEMIRQQHETLKELLGRIEVALQQRRLSIAEVGDLLGQLGDQLVRHFALEESSGYLGEAMLHSPELVGRANALLAQHPKMTRKAQKLLSESLDSPAAERWWDLTSQRLADFLAELREHERNENCLLQEAYTLDVGISD